MLDALLPAFISLLLPHLYPSHTYLTAGLWNAIHASFFCACDSLGMEHFSENPPTSSSLLFLSLLKEVTAPKTVVIAPLLAFLEGFISYDCPCTHFPRVSDTLSFSKTENFILLAPASILSSVLYPLFKIRAFTYEIHHKWMDR